MFTDPKHPNDEYPKLKGKGAELRHLGKALLADWLKHANPHDRKHAMVTAAMEASVACEQALSDHPNYSVLPEPDRSDFEQNLWSFLAYFQALHSMCKDEGVLLFSVTIKAHMLAHTALQSEYMNPVKGWCFMGEDMMHFMRQLTSASCKGNTPMAAARKVVQRWSMGFDARLKGHDVFK